MKRLLIAFVLFAPLVFAATCIDEDNGRNYTVKSLCTDPYKEKTDYCSDEEHVAEYYCSNYDKGYCWATKYACKRVEGSTGKCVDGACEMKEVIKVKEVAEPTPTIIPELFEEKVTPITIPKIEEKEYSNEGAPKPVEDSLLWVGLSGIAIVLLIIYRLSQENLGKRVKKKRIKKKTHKKRGNKRK